MKIPTEKDNILKMRAAHEKHGLSYDLAITGSSITFISNSGVEHIASSSTLTNQDLLFIQRVTDHITDRLEKGVAKLPSKSDHKVKMYGVGIPNQKRIGVDVEIDINSAYWRAAYLLGLMDVSMHDLPYTDRQVRLTEQGSKIMGVKFDSKKYYNIHKMSLNTNSMFIMFQGKPVLIEKGLVKFKYRPSKEVRLMALGSLAKKTDYFHFDGKELKKTGHKETKQIMVDAWEAICHMVHSLMHNISQKLDRHKQEFVLYWVDALIISKTAKKYVTSEIEKAGFNWKEKEIDGIIIEHGSIRVMDKGPDRVFKII